MDTLLIYDTSGYVISQMVGAVREPVGVPFLWVTIPVGKRLKMVDGIGVDVSVTPNRAMLEDVPPTEIQVLAASLAATQGAVDFLLETAI